MKKYAVILCIHLSDVKHTCSTFFCQWFQIFFALSARASACFNLNNRFFFLFEFSYSYYFFANNICAIWYIFCVFILPISVDDSQWNNLIFLYLYIQKTPTKLILLKKRVGWGRMLSGRTKPSFCISLYDRSMCVLYPDDRFFS